MKRVPIIILLAMLALSGPAIGATLREIDASELRKIASAGQAISMKRVIDSVVKATGGKPVEARAFEAGDVFYRIVLIKPNGSVVSVIINARTGEQVTKNSSLGKQVAAAAEAGSAGKGTKGKSETAGSNGNSGGNAGGNSGGNGGGNGGGGGGNGGGGGGNGGGGGGG